MSKTKPNENITNIKPGQNDSSGNKVLHILSHGNEYCIYEIEHSDINYRLRVAIDGLTDESEQLLINKFNLVKNKYIIAKGLLYRSQNYGIMKNRVSHILGSCLQNETLPNGDEFDELIKEIEEEIKRTSNNRLYYFSPSIFLTILFAFLCYIFSEYRISDTQSWQVLIVIFSSLLGSSISILSTINKINFEEQPYSLYYSLIGFERIFLSCVAGTISYLLIRSKIIFPQIEINDYWKIMSLIVVASFSEKLIPNVLGNVEKTFKPK